MKPEEEPFESFRPRFRLGCLSATPGALAALERSGQTAGAFLVRHVSPPPTVLDGPGDRARAEGLRVLSVHRTLNDETLWVITEADRSRTTLLLPEEY
jgi:hypothetical protein